MEQAESALKNAKRKWSETSNDGYRKGKGKKGKGGKDRSHHPYREGLVRRKATKRGRKFCFKADALTLSPVESAVVACMCASTAQTTSRTPATPTSEMAVRQCRRCSSRACRTPPRGSLPPCARPSQTWQWTSPTSHWPPAKAKF